MEHCDKDVDKWTEECKWTLLNPGMGNGQYESKKDQYEFGGVRNPKFFEGLRV